MDTDSLYDILEKFLDDSRRQYKDYQDLISDVVGEYIFSLMNQGFIPEHMLDRLEKDLTEEVLLMYQKKTYGFMNLHEYRRRRLTGH